MTSCSSSLCSSHLRVIGLGFLSAVVSSSSVSPGRDLDLDSSAFPVIMTMSGRMWRPGPNWNFPPYITCTCEIYRPTWRIRRWTDKYILNRYVGSKAELVNDLYYMRFALDSLEMSLASRLTNDTVIQMMFIAGLADFKVNWKNFTIYPAKKLRERLQTEMLKRMLEQHYRETYLESLAEMEAGIDVELPPMSMPLRVRLAEEERDVTIYDPSTSPSVKLWSTTTPSSTTTPEPRPSTSASGSSSWADAKPSSACASEPQPSTSASDPRSSSSSSASDPRPLTKRPMSSTSTSAFEPGPSTSASEFEPGPSSSASAFEPEPSTSISAFEPGSSTSASAFEPRPSTSTSVYEQCSSSLASAYEPEPSTSTSAFELGPSATTSASIPGQSKATNANTSSTKKPWRRWPVSEPCQVCKNYGFTKSPLEKHGIKMTAKYVTSFMKIPPPEEYLRWKFDKIYHRIEITGDVSYYSIRDLNRFKQDFFDYVEVRYGIYCRALN